MASKDLNSFPTGSMMQPVGTSGLRVDLREENPYSDLKAQDSQGKFGG